MCRDHANQHSIVPILSDDPRRELPSQHFIDIRQLGWFETMFGLPKNFPRRKITQALANKKLSVTQRILWLQVPLHSTRLEIDASAEPVDVHCDMSSHDLCTLLGFSKLLLAK